MKPTVWHRHIQQLDLQIKARVARDRRLHQITHLLKEARAIGMSYEEISGLFRIGVHRIIRLLNN